MNEAEQCKTSLKSIKKRITEAAKVMAKKGDYAFSKYRNGEVDVTYKGKVIISKGIAATHFESSRKKFLASCRTATRKARRRLLT